MTIIKNLKKKHGYGFANIYYDDETKLYQGKCSTNESTAKYTDLSQCIRKLDEMGWTVCH